MFFSSYDDINQEEYYFIQWRCFSVKLYVDPVTNHCFKNITDNTILLILLHLMLVFLYSPPQKKKKNTQQADRTEVQLYKPRTCSLLSS